MDNKKLKSIIEDETKDITSWVDESSKNVFGMYGQIYIKGFPQTIDVHIFSTKNKFSLLYVFFDMDYNFETLKLINEYNLNSSFLKLFLGKYKQSHILAGSLDFYNINNEYCALLELLKSIKFLLSKEEFSHFKNLIHYYKSNNIN